MNKVSFEQLYMEQLPGLYRLAQGILRHTADAQDAVQQAALQAWQHLDNIRPGGEKRLSNYLLWQAAYAEILFSDTLWPDFDEEELDRALVWFATRKRRFGGV